jgi:glucose dehydrogenase
MTWNAQLSAAGVLASLGTLAITGAASADMVGPSQLQLDHARSDGQDWLYVDHDYHGTRYTPVDQINTSNVSTLAPVCNYTFPEKEPAQTGHIVGNGVLYATTAHYTVKPSLTPTRHVRPATGRSIH